MKSVNLILFILISISLLTSCKKEDKLVGNWERYGDRFEGMKIHVVKEGESFKASIVFVTDSIKLGGFVVGDIKWKNIKKITDNKYEFEDLAKKQSIYTDKFEPSYVLANLEMITDDEIHTRNFSKGLEAIGTEQTWKRASGKYEAAAIKTNVAKGFLLSKGYDGIGF
ncbi:MAG: hypothetical protein Q8M08_15765 [Bacteroidales bacterium]|nr:hypothetical protein [Bacteroidales bacterium]